jgi:hypothetical protein
MESVHTKQRFLPGQTKVRDGVIQGYIKHRFSGQVRIKQVCIVPTTWRKETSTREREKKSILGTSLEDNAVSCSHEPNMYTCHAWIYGAQTRILQGLDYIFSLIKEAFKGARKREIFVAEYG